MRIKANQVLLREAEKGRWLAFREPLEVVQAWDVGQVQAALEHIQAAVDLDGLWAAGFISYEAAPAFDSALVVRPGKGFPLVWFGLYAGVQEVARLVSSSIDLSGL